jgi:hypothetical protein
MDATKALCVLTGFKPAMRRSPNKQHTELVPQAQEVMPKWTGFSRVAAAVLLPRRLLRMQVIAEIVLVM